MVGGAAFGSRYSGSFVLQPDQLRYDTDQSNDERIRLWRENRISPTGGAGGSSFTVEIRNEIEIVVLP